MSDRSLTRANLTEVDGPWYRDGLRFECTRCGRCCRGAGNVWVSEPEIAALASRLGQDAEAFREGFTRRAGKRGVILRQKRNLDCIFWDDAQGCTVYSDRPRQCRTYPFWSAFLQSEEDWRDESASCPGMDRGTLYPAEEIEKSAADDGIPPHRTRRARS